VTRTNRPLAAAEAEYLHARSARDALDVARARGDVAHLPALEAASASAFAAVRRSLGAIDARGDDLGEEDARAVASMLRGIEAAEAYLLPNVTLADADPPDHEERDDDEWERGRLAAAYAVAAGSLAADGEPVTRPQVLARLATEPDPARRQALFLALDPLWRTVDGDGDEASPYRSLIERSAQRWRAGESPIAANALALGVPPTAIERWMVDTLEGWRMAFVEPARARGLGPVEPWDWWWDAGEAHRLLRGALPLQALEPLDRAVHAALGADLDALGVELDLYPRAGRPPVAVAYTTFGTRPHPRADGSWDPGRPVVMETLTEGGLGELAELVHETGHAIHLAGIRTRPAFADWPDSDAMTEALAELVAIDVYDPAWQRRWLPGAPVVERAVGLRARYAETALDAAWALLEIRLHERPGLRPNDVWTEITSTWLGIARHPEWSWWAMRGQLVDQPGYMANYAIGAVLAADMRAAIRAERGDWIDGDPGWYPWVREHLYRFGLERPTVDVLHDVLGRPPDARALLEAVRP
jgi:hypothetical protein